MRLILVFLLFCLPAAAQEPREVDLELFLAVDVSRSMSPDELEIQRQGYAAALASPDVFAAIRGGLIGEIAVTYVEWAGFGSHKVVVPWTLVDTPEAARAIAARITAHFDPGLRRTSISAALHYAARSIENNDFRGLRRVIDISGDGPNNQGSHVTVARDRVLAKGITINGLPLMTSENMFDRWGIPDLDIYYRDCVIGGPGAFMVPVLGWDAFPAAVKRKLILEIAGGLPERPKLRRVSAYNCGIGEEIFERNMQLFGGP